MRRLWLLLILVFAFFSTAFRPRLLQGGCDSPAHLLLSETLLRSESSGSSTLRQELSQHLLGQKFTAADISRALTPICMHWDGEHAFNQYPPYLAFVLKAVPYRIRPFFFGALVFAIFLAAALTLGRGRRFDQQVQLLLLSLGIIVLPILYPDLRSVFGMPINYGLFLFLPYFFLDGRRPLASAFCLAVACGVRYDAAIPLLLISPLGLYLAKERQRWALQFGAGVLFMAVLPLALYQHAVLGDWLRPLTPRFDLAFVGGPALFFKNLGVFVTEGWSFWVPGLLAFSFRPVDARERFAKRYLFIAAAVALCLLSAKVIMMPYYLWPWGALGFGLFLVEMRRRLVWRRSWVFSLASVLVVFAVVQTFRNGQRFLADQQAFDRRVAMMKERFPKGPAFIEAQQWSAELDAIRFIAQLSFDAIITGETNTPAPVVDSLRAYLRARQIPRWGYDPSSEALDCIESCQL